MNIVTISREFGSGGRELGREVAEILGYDYYDREIISTIAERNNMDESYIEHALNSNMWQTFPLSFRHSFISPIEIHSPQINILLDQKHVIEEIAKKENISYQLEVMGGKTGTNCDEIQVSGRGIRTALISVPIRNMHTACEVCDLEDIESAARLMAEYITERSKENA